MWYVCKGVVNYGVCVVCRLCRLQCWAAMFVGHRMEIQVLQARWPFTTPVSHTPLSFSLPSPPFQAPQESFYPRCSSKRRRGEGCLIWRVGLSQHLCLPLHTHTHTHTAWSSLVCRSSVDACDPTAGHLCTTSRRTLEHGAHREGSEGGHI